jgi:hypothetical protein
MRFPRMMVEIERNDIMSSKNAYNVFATFRHLKLGFKQAVYPLRGLQNCDNEQTFIQKFQDDKVVNTRIGKATDVAKVVKKSEI